MQQHDHMVIVGGLAAAASLSLMKWYYLLEHHGRWQREGEAKIRNPYWQNLKLPRLTHPVPWQPRVTWKPLDQTIKTRLAITCSFKWTATMETTFSPEDCFLFSPRPRHQDGPHGAVGQDDGQLVWPHLILLNASQQTCNTGLNNWTKGKCSASVFVDMSSVFFLSSCFPESWWFLKKLYTGYHRHQDPSTITLHIVFFCDEMEQC